MSLDHTAGTGLPRKRHVVTLIDTFRPVYDRFFDEDDPFVVNLQSKLEEARINRPVKLYLTQAIALGVLAGTVLWLIGITLGLTLYHIGLFQVETLTGLQIPSDTLSYLIDIARIPFLIFSTGLLLGTLGFVATFGSFIARPYSVAGKRRREINTLLPDAVSFMYALSVGGMNQMEIIETMADAEDTYGEVSREFRTILQETMYFDTDYRSAIRKRAAETPSAELSQFLTDMLSIIDSGGSMRDFLDDKKDVHFRTAKEGQQQRLQTLELFTEMYITLSLFPLLLIVILVIMDMIGSGQTVLLYATVYLLIPLLGVAFLILVSTVLSDEPGDGYLEPDKEDQRFEMGQESSALDLGLINKFTGTYYIFDRIERSEGTNETVKVLKQPHVFLRDNPHYTLALTVPASVMFLFMAIVTGSVSTTWSGITDYPVWSTIIYAYVPLFTICLPLAVFWEWNLRRRRAILDGLSENLRKMASANATGLTLLESLKVVAETTPGKLGTELDNIYNKSQYGMHLRESLLVFNNKYRIPRLARTVKLISKAQEISSQISSVLSTAAKATETQEEIERERRQNALIQVAIIIMTFLTLLGVVALLKSQFVDVMASMTEDTGGTSAPGGQAFGTTMPENVMAMLFFHAVTLQAIVSGLACGYIREANVFSGVKYVVFLLFATLGVWLVVA